MNRAFDYSSVLFYNIYINTAKERTISVKSCVVSISEVARDPTHNLSAKYWCDKKEAQKKEQDSNFSEVLEEEMRKLGSNNE